LKIIEDPTKKEDKAGKQIMKIPVKLPTEQEIRRGSIEFKKHEKRGAMYKVASFLLEYYWGKPEDMANALGVLLLTWNQAFYRYGSFDYEKLEKCIADNLALLGNFRNRDISSYSNEDASTIKAIFYEFLEALQIEGGKKGGIKSPVAVAKALHLLAPAFFPLWDDKIARAYECFYKQDPGKKYLLFCKLTKEMAGRYRSLFDLTSKETLVKQIDEYNYAKYTKQWI
jgi:hypothetical protein